MNTLLIIGLIAIFVAGILTTVYFVPIMLTKWRASYLGLDLTYRQARIITKNFCNKKEFLLKVKDIWAFADISIEELTTHFNAKGDLTNLRDGVIEMKKKNREIDFRTLSTFDLAGRNLKEEIKKAEAKNWFFDLTSD